MCFRGSLIVNHYDLNGRILGQKMAVIPYTLSIDELAAVIRLLGATQDDFDKALQNYLRHHELERLEEFIRSIRRYEDLRGVSWDVKTVVQQFIPE